MAGGWQAALRGRPRISSYLMPVGCTGRGRPLRGFIWAFPATLCEAISYFREGGKMPAAVPLPSLDPCHFLREAKLPLREAKLPLHYAGLKWERKGKIISPYQSSSG